MRLSRLFVYPIKSTAGTEVQSAELDEFGLKNDRRWMIIDRDGKAITQREQPRLALVHATATSTGLELHATGFPAITVAFPDHVTRPVNIWSDTVAAADASAESARWISDFLGTVASLVYMPDSTFRSVDREYSHDDRRVSFADSFPFLLITQESMDELNRRMPQPLGIERFRPNLVVSGADYPNAEDAWKRIRIGSIDFSVVKPCARCAVPTVDPKTGARGKEPNRTLATYRRRAGEVFFGQNLIHDSVGTLETGMVVALMLQSGAVTAR